MKKDIYATGIIILLVGFLAVRLWNFFGYHELIWDEAVYVGMAKYIYSAGGAGLFEAIRPLMLPLVLGAFWKLGLDPVTIGELIAILASVGAIYMTYVLGTRVHGKLTGLLAAATLAMFPMFHQYSGSISTGILSTFFGLMAVYLFLEGKLVWSGVVAGLAFLTRFPQGLLIVVLLSALVFEYLKERKIKQTVDKLIKVGLAFFLTVLPFLIVNYFVYIDEFFKFYYSMLTPMIYGRQVFGAYDWFYDYGTMYYVFQIFARYFLGLFIVYSLVMYVKRKYYLETKYNTVLLALLVIGGYFTALTHKEFRYSIAFIPYLFIFSYIALEEIFKILKKKKKTLQVGVLGVLLVLQAGVFFAENITVREAESEPRVVKEYYKYYQGESGGKLMAADPLVAVYTDHLVIPVYFDLDKGLEMYEKHKHDVKAVMYTPRAFPCKVEDYSCLNKKSKFFSDINKDFSLVFLETYNGEDYYIFEKE